MLSENIKERLFTAPRGKAIILGIGVSNLPLAEMLADMGADIEIRDGKEFDALGDAAKKLADRGAVFICGSDPTRGLCGGELQNAVIFRSPGIRPDAGDIPEAVRRGALLTSEMEWFCDATPATVIAVTGSDGKTTTTTLTHLLLSEAAKRRGGTAYVGGNIGTPLLSRVSEMKQCDFAVLELSSFQLETTHTLNCTSAALLNITEDHINRFGSMEAYIAAKMRVFENQTEQDFAVLNADDPIVSAAETKAKKLYFSRLHEVRDGAFVRSGIIIFRMNGVETQLIPANELGIIGAHNLENALCAVCLAMSMGVKPDVVCNVLKSFKGVEHRIEYTRCLNGITFYNDSKGTNPESTVKAVEAMTKPTVLMLGVGNYDKQSDYRPVFRAFNGRVKAVVVNGSNTEAIMRAAKEEGFKNIYPCSDDFRALILKAASLAEPGDAVLLSPACASWGMFDNFEQRGDIFKEIVNSL